MNMAKARATEVIRDVRWRLIGALGGSQLIAAKPSAHHGGGGSWLLLRAGKPTA